MRVFALSAILFVCWNGAQNSVLKAADQDDDQVWLSNSHLKVGLRKSSGGAIFWISEAGSDTSLINSFDRGRLVQQSWYGKPDGSFWNSKPWRWNPVQGGDWQGKSATILEQRHESTTSWVRSTPVHWATGEVLTDCEMEQTLSLKDELIHIQYRFLYRGKETHPAHHQELPAFFTTASLRNLVYCDSESAWTGAELKRLVPVFPNQYGRITEHWAAYVNDSDFGIGCFVPNAEELTFYRYTEGRRGENHCSYFAPIRTLAVTPGFQWTYDVWITVGKVDQIRSRFKTLASKESASADLEMLKWLSGEWISMQDGIQTDEYWMAPKGGMMPGVNRTVSAGGKASFEYMRIAETPRGLTFFASPGGQAETPFLLKEASESHAVFESGQNDFPNRIIYRRKGELLTARIEGVIGGQERSMEWEWKPVKH